MGTREFDPLGAFFALARTKAAVTPESGSKALYASLRSDLEQSFAGSSDEYAQAVRKLARICGVL